MTITVQLSATVLTGITLIFLALTWFGVPMPRWLMLVAGGIAFLAGVLMLISGLGG